MNSALAKYLIISIPCVIFFAVMSHYVLNLPQMDDYDAILDFLCSYKQSVGIDHFFLLFNQQNEHRLFGSKIFYVLYDWVFGKINFINIIYLGDIQLVVILAIMVSFIRKVFLQNWFIVALVMSICMFDLNNWENGDFAMAGMQNFGIIMWFAASLYFYDKDAKWGKYIGFILQLVALFSSGNGIMASAILCLFNLLKKDRLGLVLGVIAFVVFTPVYFIHYEHPATAPHMLTGPITIIKFTLYFLSGHILFNNYLVAVAMGLPIAIALILFFPFQKKTLVRKEMLPLAAFALFMLASMAVVVLFRGYINSRYRVYPDILLPLIICFGMYKIRDKKKFYPVAISLTALLALVYVMNIKNSIDNLAIIKKTLVTRPYDYPDTARAKRFADKACMLHIYCIAQNRVK